MTVNRRMIAVSATMTSPVNSCRDVIISPRTAGFTAFKARCGGAALAKSAPSSQILFSARGRRAFGTRVQREDELARVQHGHGEMGQTPLAPLQREHEPRRHLGYL